MIEPGSATGTLLLSADGEAIGGSAEQSLGQIGRAARFGAAAGLSELLTESRVG